MQVHWAGAEDGMHENSKENGKWHSIFHEFLMKIPFEFKF